MAVCGTFYFCSFKIAHCKYHIQTIEVRVSSKSSHPGLISIWFLILPSCLNCFLQVPSHLNIRSTMAIISLYVVPHTSILFKLLNTNITFKLGSPLAIASSYSSWGNMACGSSHFSCFKCLLQGSHSHSNHRSYPLNLALSRFCLKDIILKWWHQT